MAKKVAVVSDATSAGFWFPTWYRYYAASFGSRALFLVCYDGHRQEFSGLDLGGLVTIPQLYSDDLRAKFISAYVNTLLTCYDCVGRCGIDEIVFPDLRKYRNLASYIDGLRHPYVTATGFDVVQDYAEPAVDVSRPVLSEQRKVGIVYSALHKTCVTTVSADWCVGFHGCSLYPRFDDLYLAHLKLASFEERVSWHGHMLARSVSGGREAAYYADAQDRLSGQRSLALGRPRVAGWDGLVDGRERAAFLDGVKLGRLYGHRDFYIGPFNFAEKACVLPQELAGLI